MAIKIRRCLYIGLGGTGMKSILYTKKMFMDTYGEVPPMIGFLGIDTDDGEFNNSLTSARGEVVTLNPDERLQLNVTGAVAYFEHNKDRFSWIPRDNVSAISMLNGVGAGGVRSNGRFALTINKNNIQSKVNEKLHVITNATTAEDAKFRLLAAVDPEIHMAFSISGGTGSGTFLNMAYLLREINPNFKITGYAVLPGVFQGLAASAHVVPNTYGALCDLDYLMHKGVGDANPVVLKYLGGDYTVQDRPFSNVVFVDNKDENGYTHSNVKDLAAMIGVGMLTAAGELSIAGASVGDNFNVMISMGSLDVANKKGWASGMGACEIIYRGNTLAEVYQLKAGINIIDRMFNSCDDANAIANAWIDSTEVHIRENNGQNHVTDYICSSEPRYPLIINDTRNPNTDVNSNIQTNALSTDEIASKQKELLDRVRTQLRALLVKYINRECGVALAKDIIEEIKIQIGLCLGEMRQERDDLVNRKPTLKSGVEAAVADVRSIGFFTPPGRRRDILENAAEAVRQYNICLLDIQRHDAAITIYNSLLVNFDEGEEKLRNIEGVLKQIKQSLQNKVAILQNGLAGEDAIFQINLAVDDAKSLSVRSEDIRISEFIDSLEGNLKVYGFPEYSANEIEKFIINFTKNLPGAKNYYDRGVEQVLRDLSADRFKEIINLAAVKSSAVFTYDHLGRVPQQNMIDMIYIGVEDIDNSILKEDGAFQRNLPAPRAATVTRNVAFATTGMKDKVIIYHQVGVVPAYAINGVTQSYEPIYDSRYGNKEKWHFDADMKFRMDHEDFKITPGGKVDPTMEYWTKGFIYGLIKNERGSYYYKILAKGEAIRDYWVKLNTPWRNEAYELIRADIKNVAKEFGEYITSYNARIGEAQVAELLRKANENWWEVSQVNIDLKTLDGPAYIRVRELLNKEMPFVRELANL